MIRELDHKKWRQKMIQNTLLQKRVLSAITILALIISLFAWTATTAPATYAAADVWDGTVPTANAAYAFSGGSGTQADPYIIGNAADLAQLAANVNAGTAYSGEYFQQTVDIDLGNNAWTPIGGAAPASGGIPGGGYFAGTYDGYRAEYIGTFNTYVIDGLNVQASTTAANNNGYGLFGCIQGGTLQNLSLGSGSVNMGTGNISYLGAFVGYTNGTLYNLHNVGTTVYVNNASASQAGGIAGAVENNGSTAIIVQYCSNESSVTGRGRVGGIVGAVYCANAGGVVVDSCFNEGNLTTVGQTQKSYTGGIVGYCRGYITNSYSIASLETDGGHYMAGITGILQGSGPQAALSNAYSYSLFTDANASYDRFLFASADNSTSMPIANALWVNTNSDGTAWEGDYNTDINGDAVTITQPPATSTNGWGNWTQVGSFVDTETASVYTTSGSATPTPVTASVIGVLNATSSIVTASGTVSVAGAFEQIDSAYPTLIWQRTPDIIGVTPGTPGTLDSDDATQIFLDGTLTPGTGTGTQADPYADLDDAIGDLTTGRNIIYIVDQVSISADEDIAATGITGATIKRSSTYGGYLFYITDDTTTVSDIIIDGNIAHIGAGNSLIYMTGSDAELVLGSGAVLQNNLAGQGGAIYATGASTITLNDGTIQNNIASTNLTTGAPDAYGGAIYLDRGGAATINSGTISGNKATSHHNAGSAYGGAIYISSGVVEMFGGTISGNSVDGGQNPSGGGGVYVGDIFTGGKNSEFRLEDGTISGNTASKGGGVYVASDGEFAQFGGAISGNTAETPLEEGTAAGGGVYIAAGGQYEINDSIETSDNAVISGNTAVAMANALNAMAYGGGVYIESDGEFEMWDGSVLSGNTVTAIGSGSTALGAGVYDAGTLTLYPNTSNNFNLADVVYLTDGTYIDVAKVLTNIAGSITVQCASPAAEVQVAEGSNGYTISEANDLPKFAYVQNAWSFYAEDNAIYLDSEVQ
jgi:predicted outer membrane repeat protein